MSFSDRSAHLAAAKGRQQAAMTSPETTEPGGSEADDSGPPARVPSGFWYAALIGAVLLIAAGLYILVLHQQRHTWQRAVDQLTVGQEMLRFDRDELLQKARDREAELSLLEVASEQDRTRLVSLEEQRRRLQSEVVRLTKTLAESQPQADGTPAAGMRSAELLELERDKARLYRALAKSRDDIADLRAELSEKELALADQAETLLASEAGLETLREEQIALKARHADLEERHAGLEQKLAEAEGLERRRQVIRGHRASLGNANLFLTELKPEDWRLIESWLDLQLRRPMAVPDLSGHGWSYEGARLLAAANPDDPPMAMLLYADSEGRPASLTIAQDDTGERDPTISRDGQIKLLDWREERHGFTLTGEMDEEELREIALDLQNQPPGLRDDSPVPTSRYIRPMPRPDGF